MPKGAAKLKKKPSISHQAGEKLSSAWRQAREIHLPARNDMSMLNGRLTQIMAKIENGAVSELVVYQMNEGHAGIEAKSTITGSNRWYHRSIDE